MSFRALRDLVIHTGIPPVWAWLFPAIIDTAIGVSTLMLVVLGDKPARRTPRAGTQTAPVQRASQAPVQNAKAQVAVASTSARAQTVQVERVRTSASVHGDPVQTVQDSAQTEATQVDADLASELIASGVTIQPVETVIAVLAATRDCASINAAAKASGINYRTAQRIGRCRGAPAAAAHGGRLTVMACSNCWGCCSSPPPQRSYAPQPAVPFTGLKNPGGVAVDTAGDVYVVDGGDKRC
jgi:hypothetical protein